MRVCRLSAQAAIRVQNSVQLQPRSTACALILFDIAEIGTYYRAPMSNAMPENLDPWRMVQARRIFEGSLPLAQFARLVGSLAGDEGQVSYNAEFGTDEFGLAYLDLKVEAELPMICQRTLQVFVQPISLKERLGLIAEEAAESSLPEFYEPLLVLDGQLRLKDVIEDELILALPLVALSPGAPLDQVPVTAEPELDVDQPSNPFAVLGQLKKSRLD
jgi:uncharacterized protein